MTGSSTGRRYTETRDVVIVNARGLHARPAATIAKLAERFDAEVVLVANGETVTALSIMGMMTLAAAQGAQIRLRGRGRQAAEAVDAIAQVIADGFGEED